MGRRDSSRERGYLMAALAAAVAIMVIFSMLAFQAWVDVLRRDNEAEMMFRARDLSRAIQRYRRDHGGVAPIKLELLLEPGPRGQYYLRQMWKDPLVKDGKWGLLYLGPGGQIIDPNGPPDPTGLGAGSLSQMNPVDVFDRGNEAAKDEAPRTVQERAPGSGQPLPQTQKPQRKFRTISSEDPDADPNAAGKQVAGLPIAGVRTMCDERPFRIYNGLNEYGQWQFTYLDFEVAAGSQGRQPGAPGTPGQPNRGRQGGAPGRTPRGGTPTR